MDYCEPCRRQLNGAISCPGCGAVYRIVVATGVNAAGTSADSLDQTVTVPEKAPAREMPHRSRRRDEAGRHGWWIVWGVAGLVACVAVAAVVVHRSAHGPSKPSGVVATAIGKGLPFVPPPTRLRGTDARASRPRPTGAATESITHSPAATGQHLSPSAVGTPSGRGPAGSTPSRAGTPPHNARVYSGTVVSASGRCLVPGRDNSHGGTGLGLAACTSAAGQRWQPEADGSLRNGGRCLDVINAAVDNDSPVQLFTCNRTPAQKWARDSLGEIVNPQSGRCLDASTMAIMVCTGQANQRWEMP